MSMLTKVPWRHFALIVLIASVVRGGVLWVTSDSLTKDPDAYRAIAYGLATHGVFGLATIDDQTGLSQAAPTAFRPPLYPWMLSLLADPRGVVPNAAIATMHWFLGIVTVAGTYLIGRHLLSQTFPDASSRRLDTAAIVAASLVAIDPLLLQASALVMTETLAATLVVLTLWAWAALVDFLQRDPPTLRTPLNARAVLVKGFALTARAAALSLVLGLAYLCRPTFIVWPLLLALYLSGWAIYRRRTAPAIACVVLLLGVAVFVAGWTVRNKRHYGKPIWATTHGGYTLLLGNNASFYEYLGTPAMIGKAWDASFFLSRWSQRSTADPREAAFWQQSRKNGGGARQRVALDEVADDQLAYETALATIKRHPSRFLQACLWRVVRLHSPLPLYTTERTPSSVIGVGTFYSILLIIILTGIWKAGRQLMEPRWMAAVTLWATLVAVHTVYWADMRMRAPAVPVWCVLAAVGSMPRSRTAAGDPNLVSTHQSTTSASAR